MQIGHLPHVPFAVGCPCGVVLRGSLHIDQEKVEFQVVLDNADMLYALEDAHPVQEVQCSGELPVLKRVKGVQPYPSQPSAFINASMSMGIEKLRIRAERLQLFLHNWQNHSEHLGMALDLMSAKNYTMLQGFLNREFEPNLVASTPHKAFWVLVSKYRALCGMIYQDTLEASFQNYTTTLVATTRRFGDKNTKDNVGRLIQLFQIHELIAGGLRVVHDFLGQHAAFFPIIFLDGFDEERPYGDRYQITSVDFSDTLRLYTESFEWLGKFLTVLLAVCNLGESGDIDVLPQSLRMKNGSDLSSFHGTPNGKKKELVSNIALLAEFLTDVFDHEIRNSVSHGTNQINVVQQQMSYPAKPYGNNPKLISLVDMADLTYRQLRRVVEGVFVCSLLLCVSDDVET